MMGGGEGGHRQQQGNRMDQVATPTGSIGSTSTATIGLILRRDGIATRVVQLKQTEPASQPKNKKQVRAAMLSG
jgi:hypothetical protein